VILEAALQVAGDEPREATIEMRHRVIWIELERALVAA